MSDESRTSDVKRQAKSDLQQGKERAKEAARGAAAEGKDKLEAQSQAAATRVDDVADAIGSAASRLDELEHEGLADYANQMASALSNMSVKLRDKSVDELARDVSDLARRNPALFLLGSVALGLGLSRFAKATRHRQGDRDTVDDTYPRSDEPWRGSAGDEFVPHSVRNERTSPERTTDANGGGL